jgi:2-polyprenyl-3-methyl-5-hydroxy-6-metoxy-1,4-benzoquinol methylase
MALPLSTETDPRYGSRRLSAHSSTGDVHAYFRKAYYDAVQGGQKGVDIKRSLDGGQAAEAQRRWMAQTLYADIAWLIESLAPGKRVLDAGCGTGDLLTDLAARGFEVEGVELALAALQTARAKGLTVHDGAFESFAPARPFDAVLFMHVLSHAAEPQPMLEHARKILGPGGVLLIRSGNDFNALQQVLSGELGHREYWVSADHQHYFDFASIERLMDAAGFDLVYSQSDFPMEMIALMGQDFIADPALGKTAHEQRVQFEMQVPAETRRKLYRAFAQAGLGRCVLMAGRAR